MAGVEDIFSPFAENSRSNTEAILRAAEINSSRAMGPNRVVPSTMIDLTLNLEQRQQFGGERPYTIIREAGGARINVNDGHQYDPKCMLAGLLNGLRFIDTSADPKGREKVSFCCETIAGVSGTQGREMTRFTVNPDQAVKIFMLGGEAMGMSASDLQKVISVYEEKTDFGRWPGNLRARHFLPTLKERLEGSVVANTDEQGVVLGLKAEITRLREKAETAKRLLDEKQLTISALEDALAATKREVKELRAEAARSTPGARALTDLLKTSDKTTAKSMLEAIFRERKVTLARINAGGDVGLKAIARRYYEEVAKPDLQAAAQVLGVEIPGI